MNIEVQSFIPWLQHVNGTYDVKSGTTVSEFLQQLLIEWDQHVLVGLNNRIAKAEDRLAAGDQVVLMIPLSGG
jgi:sulfur carrier protein ThiS